MKDGAPDMNYFTQGARANALTAGPVSRRPARRPITQRRPADGQHRRGWTPQLGIVAGQ
jgi:hypothetical protein